MALSIATLIVLTGKLRIHAFLALISVSIVMGFVFGLPPSDLIKYIVEGFGGTVGYVGLMVFAATIIGELLAKTGAAAMISESFLKFIGKSRLAAAIGSSGYLVAPPVTCNDTAFLILSPAARALGIAGGYSAVFVSLALAAGAYSSFKLVFPAAPLYAAAVFQANLAEVILLGFLVSIPVFAVGLLWTHTYTRYGLPHSSRPHSPLAVDQSLVTHGTVPSTIESYAAIAVPLALILGRALADGYMPETDGVRGAIDLGSKKARDGLPGCRPHSRFK